MSGEPDVRFDEGVQETSDTVTRRRPTLPEDGGQASSACPRPPLQRVCYNRGFAAPKEATTSVASSGEMEQSTGVRPCI